MKKQNAVVHYLQKTFYLKHRKLERKGMWKDTNQKKDNINYVTIRQNRL